MAALVFQRFSGSIHRSPSHQPQTKPPVINMSYFNCIEETKHEIFHILKSPPSSCYTNNNAAAASLNHSSCPMLASLACRASLNSPRSPVRCMDPEGRAPADTDTSTLLSDTLSLLYKLNSAYIAFKYNSNHRSTQPLIPVLILA